MKVYYLLADELNYELKIRGVKVTNTDTVYEKRRILGELLRDELVLNKSLEVVSKEGVSSEEEFAFCLKKAAELEQLLTDVRRARSDKYQTRFEHLARRVARLSVKEEGLEILEDLKSRVKAMGERLEAANQEEEESGDEYSSPTGFRSSDVSPERKLSIDPTKQLKTSTPIIEKEAITPAISVPIPEVSANSLRNEGQLVDRLAGLLDATLQKLEGQRGTVLPIRKWGVSFSGEVDGTSVITFLNAVEEKRRMANMSDDRLLAGAADLFSGPALIWYRSIRHELDNWEELVTRIRTCFLPTHFEVNLWDEIRARKQGKKETCIMYIASIRELFSRFSHPPAELEQVNCVLTNIQPYFATQLSLITIRTFDHLVELCVKLEYTRLNNEKLVGQGVSQIDSCQEACQTGNGTTDKIKHGPISKKRYRVLQCWNCGEAGHGFQRCRKELTTFCFLCGEPGVTVPTCSRRHLNSKRRSDEPSAPYAEN